VSATKLSLKIPAKRQFGEQKALAVGGYTGQRFGNVFTIYQPKRHHVMPTATTIICWSAVSRVGPVSFL